MSIYKLTNKSNPAFAEIVVGDALISVFIYENMFVCSEHYTVNLNKLAKVKSYKSVSGLAKFAKANHEYNLIPQLPLIDYEGAEIVRSEKVPAVPTALDNIVFLGLSLAGIEVGNCEIIEVALVDRHEQILFHSQVRPSKKTYCISPSSKSFYGIDWFDILDADFLIEHWLDIQSVLKDKTIGMYHASNAKSLIAGTYHNVFSINDYGNEFDKLFPDCKVVSVINEYCKATGYLHPASTFDWSNDPDALFEQKIPSDDMPDKRALSSAIKSARLYRHIHDV